MQLGASSPSGPARHAIQKRIRTLKKDSAFVYAVLEAHEGITQYSTLDFVRGSDHRDLELLVSPDFLGDLNAMLEDLKGVAHELATDIGSSTE